MSPDMQGQVLTICKTDIHQNKSQIGAKVDMKGTINSYLKRKIMLVLAVMNLITTQAINLIQTLLQELVLSRIIRKSSIQALLEIIGKTLMIHRRMDPLDLDFTQELRSHNQKGSDHLKPFLALIRCDSKIRTMLLQDRVITNIDIRVLKVQNQSQQHSNLHKENLHLTLTLNQYQAQETMIKWIGNNLIWVEDRD